MKRILQVVGTMDRAGAETMVMNLYRSIDRTKFQFDFLYFTNKKCDYDDEIEFLGGNIYRIVEKNPIKRMLKTSSLLKENPQWQTIHCHTLFSNASHIYAGKMAGVKQRIAHSHNTSDLSKNKLVSNIYQWVSRIIQKKYSTDFVACGVEAGKFLFPGKSDVLILPNSIDVENFASIGSTHKNYLRNEFNLKPQTKIILQLGRLNKVKNHIFSFKVIEELRRKGIDFCFFIAGQGNLKDELEKEVKLRKLEEYVVFLGLRTDVPYLLAGSDLMLMPSLHEGFPVVLVEAQATGTPALISSSISSEVDLGVKAVYFESLESQPKVWAENILNVFGFNTLRDDDRINILKKNGYDIKTNTLKLEKIYSK